VSESPGLAAPGLRPLGVGMTYWPALGSLFQSRADVIDVVEVSPETLWLQDGRGGYVGDQAQLDLLGQLPVPKVIHGVTNPVGGSAAPDPVRLDLVSAMIESFGSELASEHLSFARAGSPDDGFDFTGFMLPPRQTGEGVRVAATTARAMAATRTPSPVCRGGSMNPVKSKPSSGLPARAMAARVRVPFAIENGVSYLRRRRDELADGEFVAAVAQQADVGILLDLHNAYANERNGRDSMAAFVAALPLERVVELHLAGGLPHGRYWLDAHSGAMPDAVFGFARELAGSLPSLRVVNFELMPMYFAQFGADGVARELDRCHEVWAARRSPAIPRPGPRRAAGRPATSPPSPAAWERELATLVRGAPAAAGGELTSDADEDLSSDPGIDVLRFLIAAFRAGMLARGLKLATGLLLLHLGEAAVRAIHADFFASRPPELFAGAEAEAFADYLSGLDLDVPHLASVVSFELALQHAAAAGEATSIDFAGDPQEILLRLAGGTRPPPPTAASQTVVVEPAGRGAS
jgi:uncharacterized protein (UPF0276 family)